MDNQKDIFREDIVDIRAIVRKVFSYWHYFLISIISFVVLAFLFIRYSEPQWKISSTLLVRDESNSTMGAENLLDELELFSGKKNIENEIGLIHSYGIIYKTITDLKFYVSYFTDGNIRMVGRYREMPFEVVVDTSSPQIVNLPFSVKIISDSEYILEAEGEELEVYNYGSNSINKRKIASVKFIDTLFFGDVFQRKNIKFRIFYKPIEDPFYDEDDNFIFTINDMDRLAEAYRTKLLIEPINKDASILQLSLEGNLVQREVDFLTKLAEVYIATGLTEKNQMATNTINFIDDELVGVSDSLKATEHTLEKFRSNNKVMDISYEAKSIFDNLKELEHQRALELVKAKYFEYLSHYVETNKDVKEVIAPSAMGIQDPLLNNLINELRLLYVEKTSLSYSTKSKNPNYNILLLKIDHARKALIENVSNIKSSSSIALNDLSNRIKLLERKSLSLPKNERDLVNIQRSYNLNNNIYTYLLQKRAEVGIAKASNTADNKIVDAAKRMSKEPISPNKKLTYLLALIMGIIVSFGLIILKEVMNDKIMDVQQIEKSGIPMLGVIGHNFHKNSIPIIEFPKSSISESIRSLRVNLQFVAADKEKKIIGITSTLSGEGKTFCSVNLACAIAATGAKTLILGADLRRPRLQAVFNSDNNVGISSYLINKASLEEIIQKTPMANLDLISSGPIPPNPNELLALPLLKDFFEILKSKYDYIIIDSSPIGLVSDYFMLSQYIDSTIFLLRHNYSSNKFLTEIKSIKDNARLKNLYIVLNDNKSFSSRYGSRYNYSGYYEEEKLTLFSSIKKYFKKA